MAVEEGHMFNLPLKHLEIFVFPSARPFSEDAGNSGVNDQNHMYLLLGYQHFCSKLHLKCQSSIQFRTKLTFSTGVPFEATQPPNHLTREIPVPEARQHWRHASQ